MIFELIVVALLLALFILIIYLRRTEVPRSIYTSKIKYSDHAKKPVRAFFSSKYGLTGKPDYILHTRHGLIPLEIKNSKRPRKPYFSHVMQLVSYCILLEEETGKAPQYGFLQYNTGRPFSIPYTIKEKEFLLKTIEKMKYHLESDEAPLPDKHSKCQIHN